MEKDFRWLFKATGSGSLSTRCTGVQETIERQHRSCRLNTGQMREKKEQVLVKSNILKTIKNILSSQAWMKDQCFISSESNSKLKCRLACDLSSYGLKQFRVCLSYKDEVMQWKQAVLSYSLAFNNLQSK